MSIATLLPDGKIELPEEISNFLHLQVGSQLSFTITQDQVVVQTICSTAHPAQLLARRYKPQRHNLVDEFIAERCELAKPVPVQSLKGMLKRPDAKVVSIEAMNEAITQEASV